MATTTTRLGLKVIDTPATDTVDQLRLSINNHASILDAQYLESTYALRPAAASKGRLHRSTDTGEIAIDTGSAWEPVWGAPSISRSVLDVGQVGQTRAGRQLAAADFTDCGLGAPVALWNLGGLTDVGGGGLSLTNKGSVTFGVGIEGGAGSCATFTGSASQALYIADTGGSDPFRVKSGSFGCWVRTARRGQTQTVMAKCGATYGSNTAFLLTIGATNRPGLFISKDGGSTNVANAQGVTDVADDRWHFIVGTYDGQMARLYVDGALEASGAMVGGAAAIFGSSEPFNIGARDADGITAAALPHFGAVDEAFVTGEVLSLEQVRHLYGVKLTHGMSSAPRKASLRVTRRRLGAALANGDFPSNPARAHNFAAGALTDLNGGASVSAVGGGSIIAAAGPDGQKDSGQLFSGAHTGLGATDAGLPSGTAARSYGCWFNTGTVLGAAQSLVAWGTNATAHASTFVENNGLLTCRSGADLITGPFVADGQWHHVVVVEDNSAADGVKRKLYLDGALVGASTTLTSLTLIGANGFRLGASTAGSQPLAGSLSRAFVFAGALTADQAAALYGKAATAGVLQASPKDAAEHVEGMGASTLVFIGDELEPQFTVDLEVSR